MPDRIPTEDEVRDWDLETALAYAREGLTDYAGELSELRVRRDVLITSEFGDLSPVLREVVMLSLAINDIDTVREVVGWLEDAGDPVMGYFVYKAMNQETECELAEEFLMSAAQSGYFRAQRILSDRAAKSFGVLSFVMFPLFRLVHGFRVLKVALRDANDLRLR